MEMKNPSGGDPLACGPGFRFGSLLKASETRIDCERSINIRQIPKLLKHIL